ncbi:MAG: hypothetical protein N2517_08340 [Ignavibacteria bacterium]|nr:hypothetical protein [Ignavibacteria bacterium]
MFNYRTIDKNGIDWVKLVKIEESTKINEAKLDVISCEREKG